MALPSTSDIETVAKSLVDRLFEQISSPATGYLKRRVRRVVGDTRGLSFSSMTRVEFLREGVHFEVGEGSRLANTAQAMIDSLGVPQSSLTLAVLAIDLKISQTKNRAEFLANYGGMLAVFSGLVALALREAEYIDWLFVLVAAAFSGMAFLERDFRREHLAMLEEMSLALRVCRPCA